MKYADVRPEIEALFQAKKAKAIDLRDFYDQLCEKATLHELYQKLEDYKSFGDGEKLYNDIFFRQILDAIAQHKDPASIKVMLRFCNDEMYASCTGFLCNTRNGDFDFLLRYHH